ncbi:MAG: glycosyltransferase family 4 protein [Clostridia bacterium]|nr:glycosyltransferase family 4 protein [Clostridia bacterium]
MKILFINYQALPIPDVKGGAVEYLVNSYLKYNEENHLHDITLYSIFDNDAKIKSKEYKFTEFKFIKIKSIFDKLDRIARHIINRYTKIYVGNTYISKVIRNEKDFNKYDAIIIENAPEFGLKIRKKFKNKLILHLHNDYLNKNTKNAKKILNCYDFVYTISDTLGSLVKTIENTNKVKTLYNGVNLNKFSKDENLKKVMKEKYSIKDDDFVYMYCGRLTKDKGAYELCRAFSQIDDPDIKLIIAGGTGYSTNAPNETLLKIKELEDKRIILTGFVPYDKINCLYQLADVGVVPSVCQDAFNLTVIEFASNGIPLIISDLGAMKELVNENFSVVAKYDKNYIDNLKNCLLYMKEADIKKMGEEAKKISCNFSIENYCERFTYLLNNI